MSKLTCRGFVNLYNFDKYGKKDKTAAKKELKADWKCQECGRLFRTLAAAEKAANSGCPKCGSGDVDVN